MDNKQKVAGVPLVLVIHAIIFAFLVGVIMIVLLVRLVTNPLYDLGVKVDKLNNKLEVEKTANITPTATPEATLKPTVTVKQLRVSPVSVSPVVTGK